MRKFFYVLIAVIAILFILAGFESVHAIDLNLINSVRENEISYAENLAVDNNTGVNNLESSNTVNNGYNTSYPQSQTDTTANKTQDVASTTTVTTTTGTTSSNILTIENILNILLIVVGFLLILLGIAIMIRMKH